MTYQADSNFSLVDSLAFLQILRSFCFQPVVNRAHTSFSSFQVIARNFPIHNKSVDDFKNLEKMSFVQ